jgi:transposase-like protein
MADKNSALGGESTRPGLRWCNACRKPFSVTVNSVFENSKIPLNLWLYANHLICNSKTPISGHQLARALGVTYKTAWYMARHIREALTGRT